MEQKSSIQKLSLLTKRARNLDILGTLTERKLSDYEQVNQSLIAIGFNYLSFVKSVDIFDTIYREEGGNYHEKLIKRQSFSPEAEDQLTKRLDLTYQEFIMGALKRLNQRVKDSFDAFFDDLIDSLNNSSKDFEYKKPFERTVLDKVRQAYQPLMSMPTQKGLALKDKVRNFFLEEVKSLESFTAKREEGVAEEPSAGAQGQDRAEEGAQVSIVLTDFDGNGNRGLGQDLVFGFEEERNQRERAARNHAERVQTPVLSQSVMTEPLIEPNALAQFAASRVAREGSFGQRRVVPHLLERVRGQSRSQDGGNRLGTINIPEDKTPPLSDSCSPNRQHSDSPFDKVNISINSESSTTPLIPKHSQKKFKGILKNQRPAYFVYSDDDERPVNAGNPNSQKYKELFGSGGVKKRVVFEDDLEILEKCDHYISYDLKQEQLKQRLKNASRLTNKSSGRKKVKSSKSDLDKLGQDLMFQFKKKSYPNFEQLKSDGTGGSGAFGGNKIALLGKGEHHESESEEEKDQGLESLEEDSLLNPGDGVANEQEEDDLYDFLKGEPSFDQEEAARKDQESDNTLTKSLTSSNNYEEDDELLDYFWDGDEDIEGYETDSLHAPLIEGPESKNSVHSSQDLHGGSFLEEIVEDSLNDSLGLNKGFDAEIDGKYSNDSDDYLKEDGDLEEKEALLKKLSDDYHQIREKIMTIKELKEKFREQIKQKFKKLEAGEAEKREREEVEEKVPVCREKLLSKDKPSKEDQKNVSRRVKQNKNESDQFLIKRSGKRGLPPMDHSKLLQLSLPSTHKLVASSPQPEEVKQTDAKKDEFLNLGLKNPEKKEQKSPKEKIDDNDILGSFTLGDTSLQKSSIMDMIRKTTSQFLGTNYKTEKAASKEQEEQDLISSLLPTANSNNKTEKKSTETSKSESGEGTENTMEEITDSQLLSSEDELEEIRSSDLEDLDDQDLEKSEMKENDSEFALSLGLGTISGLRQVSEADLRSFDSNLARSSTYKVGAQIDQSEYLSKSKDGRATIYNTNTLTKGSKVTNAGVYSSEHHLVVKFTENQVRMANLKFPSVKEITIYEGEVIDPIQSIMVLTKRQLILVITYTRILVLFRSPDTPLTSTTASSLSLKFKVNEAYKFKKLVNSINQIFKVSKCEKILGIHNFGNKVQLFKIERYEFKALGTAILNPKSVEKVGFQLKESQKLKNEQGEYESLKIKNMLILDSSTLLVFTEGIVMHVFRIKAVGFDNCLLLNSIRLADVNEVSGPICKEGINAELEKSVSNGIYEVCASRDNKELMVSTLTHLNSHCFQLLYLYEIQGLDFLLEKKKRKEAEKRKKGSENEPVGPRTSPSSNQSKKLTWFQFDENKRIIEHFLVYRGFRYVPASPLMIEANPNSQSSFLFNSAFSSKSTKIYGMDTFEKAGIAVIGVNSSANPGENWLGEVEWVEFPKMSYLVNLRVLGLDEVEAVDKSHGSWEVYKEVDTDLECDVVYAFDNGGKVLRLVDGEGEIGY